MSMRLLRVLAPVACVCAIFASQPSASTAPAAPSGPRAVRGAQDVLYAAPGDANYAYGPKNGLLRALRTNAAAAPTATFVMTYDAGFDGNPSAKAAFQAAVDIWAQTIVSSVP